MGLSASEYVFEKKPLRNNLRVGGCGSNQDDLDLGVSVDTICFQMLACAAGAPLVKQKNKESLGEHNYNPGGAAKFWVFERM